MNASDLASLVPQGGSDEGASLLPKLIELQNKLEQTEGEVVAHSQAHPPAFVACSGGMMKLLQVTTKQKGEPTSHG